MKIYLLLAHPDHDTFNGEIADAYNQAALGKGHEVRYQQLGEMKFDPILWKGYKQVQELEPDLKQAQENILWCDKWVIIYPMWWGNIPALFKGFIDRTILPGFGFKYHQQDPMWDKLLKNKRAELISTCDAPALWVQLMYHNSDYHALKNATLGFCGFKPVKLHRIGRTKYLNEAQRKEKINAICRSIKQAG